MHMVSKAKSLSLFLHIRWKAEGKSMLSTRGNRQTNKASPRFPETPQARILIMIKMCMSSIPTYGNPVHGLPSREYYSETVLLEGLCSLSKAGWLQI